MSAAAGQSVEVPSGKGAGDENFPVGSFLIARRLRPHVATFYAYARAVDDIADDARLSADEKVRRLDLFEAALLGERPDDPALATAHRMRESLVSTGVADRHCRDLLIAFRNDARLKRYCDFDDLIHGYCDYSAAPVGRYLLDLHGEGEHAYAFSDALSNALQVLNHLQDIKPDWQRLSRVYIPTAWMDDLGIADADLAADRAADGLRTAIDRLLDGVARLMAEARRLPGALRDRRLAMEAAVIVRLADRLAARLRGGDPLAARIALSKGDFAVATFSGAAGALFGPDRRKGG